MSTPEQTNEADNGQSRLTAELADRYWDCRCGNCGWAGSTEHVAGGISIADTGDYSELRCPICNSTDIQEQI